MSKAQSKKQLVEVSLNVDETKEMLNYVIDNNDYLQSNGINPISIEIKGESGLGKTSLIKQEAQDRHLNFVKLNLAQIEELGDLVGYPIKQLQGEKGNELIWIDEPAVEFYVKNLGYNLTGENRMSYCPPEWISNRTNGGIFLLDDWTRGDGRFVQATMELIDRQEYISWKLPKGWTILLTSNPDDGDYAVNSIDPAQRTRFVRTNLKFDINCWARWAEASGIDGRCINFFLGHYSEIIGKDREINPRSITLFFNSLSSIKDFENPKSLQLIQMLGQGSVGQEISLIFLQFIENRLDKILTPQEILDTGRDENKVLNDLINLVGDVKKDSYRNDIASILATRIVNYSLNYAKTEQINGELVKRIASLFKNSIFQTDIASNSVKQISMGSTKFKSLLLDPSLTKYIAK